LPNTLLKIVTQCCAFLLLSAVASHAIGAVSAPKAHKKKLIPKAFELAVQAASNPTLALYDTLLNQQAVGDGRFLVLPTGQIYVHAAEFIKWRLRTPNVAAMTFEGQSWYALSSLAGAQFQTNAATQSITIQLDAEAFLAAPISLIEQNVHLPKLPPWGAYSNYELMLAQASNAQQVITGLNAQVFGPYGNLSNSLVAQNLKTAHMQRSQLIRQETRWSRDWPLEQLNTQLGDSQVNASLWGRSAHFAGIHIARNFTTQPDVSITTMPLLFGAATLPSTGELYVDGVLRKTFAVPIGPFQLTDFPELAGQGEVKMIIRDDLGREQQVFAPYAATPSLLKAGVLDYSFNLGRLRRNFAQANNDYGQFMSVLSVRQGYQDKFTAELRGELASQQLTLGAGGSALTPLGVISSAFAGSVSGNGLGTLALLSLDKQSKTGLSYALKTQLAQASFVQTQEEIFSLPVNAVQPQFINATTAQLQALRTLNNPLRLASVNLGWRFADGAHLSASYALRGLQNLGNTQIATLNYNTRIAANLSLSSTLLAVVGNNASQSLLFSLSMPLGQQGAVANANLAIQNKQLQPILQIQQAASAETGLGYHGLLVGGANSQQEAGATWQRDNGVLDFALGHTRAGGSYRAAARGAIAYLDGQFFPTRTINDSFALVHIPGYAQLPVLSNSRVVAHTNARGDALLPDLSAYRNNRISVDPLTLPLDAQIVTADLGMIPYRHSGLTATLGIKRSRSALLSIVLANGAPAPIGMTFNVNSGTEKFMVGMRGEVYITELGNLNKLNGEWQGKHCSFDYSPPLDSTEIAYSEPISCKLSTQP
jgi:outer membrane usher protein